MNVEDVNNDEVVNNTPPILLVIVAINVPHINDNVASRLLACRLPANLANEIKNHRKK
jgi:hypothetical protein